MRKAVIAIFALLAMVVQPVQAASPQEIKIKLKTTWKVARVPDPLAALQPIPLDDRFFLSYSGSTRLTPAQSQLYWLDNKFKEHAIVLNPKQISRAGGFVAFNNRYFFEAYLGATKSGFFDVLSVDGNDKIKKWQFPGYKSCTAGIASGDYLYVGCSSHQLKRAKGYNPKRAGARAAAGWNFNVDSIFAISKSDKITKVDLPAGHSVDLIWLGAHQILVQSDSTTDSRNLSYFYLENGKLTHQFDLPDSVVVGQLTSAGWSLNMPSDINSPLFGCPVGTVLSKDGQFEHIATAPSCVTGFPDARITGLVFHGFLTDGTHWQNQGQSECVADLGGKNPVFIGFFNGTVLCQNDFETGDNMIHAFASTYVRPQLPSDSFPDISQGKVPSAPAYTPEATTPAKGSGFPSLCPEVVNTANKNEPSVVGFLFDATQQKFERIGEGTNVAATAPASLVGCYADFETLLSSPGGNLWAIGSISHDETGYYWVNGEGIKWSLALSGSVMNTGKENPYYSDGHQFVLQSSFLPLPPKPAPSPILQAAGVGDAKWPAKCPAVMDTVGGPQPKISGYKFDGSGGENYMRLVDGGSTAVTSPGNLLGCYADIPSLNGAQANAWHIGTINRDASGYYWQNAAGVRWGLTLSGTILITDKSNPYYDKGHQFITY